MSQKQLSGKSRLIGSVCWVEFKLSHNHATVRVLRDLNGDMIQATRREELERLLENQPYIKRMPDGDR